MGQPLRLYDVMQTGLRDDEQARRTLGEVQEQLLLEVDQYSRTVARDRFNRIAKQPTVSVVTEHRRPETASVIIRLDTLTGLLVDVVRAARSKRDRVPFTLALAQMKPVEGAVRRLDVDTGAEHHEVRAADTGGEHHEVRTRTPR